MDEGPLSIKHKNEVKSLIFRNCFKTYFALILLIFFE